MTALWRNSNGDLVRKPDDDLVRQADCPDCDCILPCSCPCGTYPPASWPCVGLLETYSATMTGSSLFLESGCGATYAQREWRLNPSLSQVVTASAKCKWESVANLVQRRAKTGTDPWGAWTDVGSLKVDFVDGAYWRMYFESYGYMLKASGCDPVGSFSFTKPCPEVASGFFSFDDVTFSGTIA